MKAKNILTVCALCILASCANSSKDKQTLNDNDSLSVVNSSIDVNSLTIDEINKSDSLVQGQYKMLANYVVDYPESGNEYLLRNLREWINESLGGNYDGNLDKPEKMLDYYIKTYNLSVLLSLLLQYSRSCRLYLKIQVSSFLYIHF